MKIAITAEKTINELDLDPSISCLIWPPNQNWPEDDVRVLAAHYRRFLYFKLKYSNEDIVIFTELEEFWHSHILATKNYFEDCHKVFGRYLHHTPKEFLDHEEEEAYLLIERTMELLKKEFPEAL